MKKYQFDENKEVEQLTPLQIFGGFMGAILVLTLLLGVLAGIVYFLWLWPLVCLVIVMFILGLTKPVVRFVKKTVSRKVPMIVRQWKLLEESLDDYDERAIYNDRKILYQERTKLVHPFLRHIHRAKATRDGYLEKKRLAGLTKELKKTNQHQKN